MKKYLLPFSLLAVILCTSCASIVSKSYYNVRLNSSPEAATVQVIDRNGREVFNGQTPTQVELKSGAGYFRKAEYTVKYTKEGYLPKTITITSDVNGWYFGNIIFGGLIGLLIIDPATGAMYKLVNTDRNETLAPAENTTGSTGTSSSSTAGTSTGEKTLHIMDIQQVPENLRKKLVLIK